jgi:hydrogenase maturation factor
MHDPTEGGISSALWEMAQAADATLRIDAGAIPVFPETEAICSALRLDPLGLLASGALLAVVSSADAPAVVERLAHDGIDGAVIGTVESGPPGVILVAEDRALPFPSFARDELARYYDAADGEHAETTPTKSKTRKD